MKLRWEPARQGIARGFSVEGHQLAQVAYVEDVNGANGAWMVWLLHPEGELFDRFSSAGEAMAAAEAAVDPNGQFPTSEDD